MNETLREWMKKATIYEQERLAKFADTSRSYMYKLVIGNRRTSPDIAAKLENASRVLFKETKGRLHVLRRENMADICAECVYSPKCKKK